MNRNNKLDTIEYGNNVNYRWKDVEPLKGTYKNIHAGEVVTKKLSKEEMDKFLKDNFGKK